MELPAYIADALERIRFAGAEGFAVGGCVRDSLLGREVNDYDLAVSTPPERTKEIFSGCKVIETGIAHGTVTVVLEGHNVEITTFRTDGDYLDGRHPLAVRFTDRIADDLSRRDFTVNAMAFSPETGLVDPFGGREDLKNGVLRCVGDPDTRFNEDALRLLRALRFASVLDLTVEPATAASVNKNAGNLRRISAERIFTEIKKLLCGKAALRVLLQFKNVVCVCLPALDALSGADYTAACAAAAALRSPAPSFAALFAFSGEAAAEEACRALKTDNRFRTHACFLLRYRENRFASPGEAGRFLGRYGRENCRSLLRFQAAFGKADPLLAAACAEDGDACRTLKDLAVNGADLQALGLRGKAVGKALNGILRRVTEGELPNDRETLLSALRGETDRTSGG